MKVELAVRDWNRLRKQQRRWQLANHIAFLRRWAASTREIIL
jgi:hypothetical protein